MTDQRYEETKVILTNPDEDDGKKEWGNIVRQILTKEEGQKPEQQAREEHKEAYKDQEIRVINPKKRKRSEMHLTMIDTGQEGYIGHERKKLKSEQRL